MAVKSILEAQVDDEAFKRFLDLFNDYQEKLGDLPDEWKKVDDAMTGAGKNFAKTSRDTNAILAGMGASSATIVEAIHHATKAQKDFEHATHRSHRALHGVEQTAKKLSGTIFGIGKWMLKWGTLGGGLAGIAGGIGLDDLANSAMSRQRSARGVGMTPGQEAAFNTYFGQFGGTQGVESGIANARNDVSKRWIFAGMGISESDLAHKSNFALSIEAERRAQQIVKNAPRGEMLNVARARGLLDLFTPDQLRVLRHTSAARLNSAASGASRSVGALGFTPAVARDWVQFSIALKRAGVEIESSLVTGLHRLTPELTELSREFSKWISAFLQSPAAAKIVAGVQTGLQSLASFLGSAKFGSDLKSFEQNIGTVASELVAIVKGIEPYAKAAGWVAAHAVGAAKDVAHGAAAGVHGLEDAYRWTRREIYGSANNPGNIRHQNQFGKWVENRYATPAAGMAAMAHLLKQYPSKHHADTIASIVPIWNGHGKNDAEYIKRVSEWSGYKPDQHLNLNDQTVRDRIMSAMIREEHSTKVTPTQVQATIDSKSNRTQRQTNALLKRLATQGLIKPTLTIRNQTSARVAVQANAAAY